MPKVVKRKKIKRPWDVQIIRGELLEVMAEDLTFREAMKLKRQLNLDRTPKEREEIVYWVERR